MAAPQRSKQEEIKATIYALVQEKQKVLYDKEQIQQLCEIKGKNWVTRSVNLLIQEGARFKKERFVWLRKKKRSI